MSNGFAPDDVVATFVEGFGYLQRLMGPVDDETRAGVRFLTFAGGRRGTRYMVELFPHEVAPERAIRVATEVAGDRPHFVSALGHAAPDQIDAYRAAGYECWGAEVVMARAMREPIASPAIAVREVADVAEGQRIVTAQERAELRPHPITAAHLADPRVFNRWVEIDGEPAAFGRIVALGERSYLSDIVTLPAFRRRGLGAALVGQLLLNARDAGAATCVLTSSDMGHPLYLGLGFVDVMPLVGFQRG